VLSWEVSIYKVLVYGQYNTSKGNFRMSYIYMYMCGHKADVFLYKKMNSVMSDWKPNVLRGYLEIGAYSYLLRFQCIGNTIATLSCHLLWLTFHIVTKG
jgi:hypothetical protein